MECTHESCTCVIAGEEEFCGPACRDHATTDDVESTACFCGHAECGAAMEDTPPVSTGPLA